MRIFVALDINESVRARIAGFMESAHEFAPEARWVKPESLHVTLKFIGEKSNEEVEQVALCLRTIQAGVIEMNFRRYGFFPTSRAPRLVWIGIDSGPALSALAALINEKFAVLKIPTEDHAYTPHLTLARHRGGSGAPRPLKDDRPNPSFQRLQEKLSEMPILDFGTMMAHEFFLYRSQLSPKGSTYTKLASFPLRDAHTQ